MMRSGCTSASAQAFTERRWIALVALLLAWGTGAGAAPRGFPCNESWDVRPNNEVQVELRVPRAGVAWDPCDATCVWRVRATEEWAWLLLRFARSFEGPDIDFVPEGEASSDGSRGNSSSSSEDKAEGGSPLHLELEVRWPRPDGSWLRTRLRDYSLESVSRMRVPASRAVLTLREPACAEDPAPSAVLHLAPPPAAFQLFAAVLGGCFAVASVVLLASCLCCNWRRRTLEDGCLSAVPRRRLQRPRRRRRSVGRACLLRAFHAFMRTSRRNLELEERLPDEKDGEAPGDFKWPRAGRAYNVAWSSHDPGGSATRILMASSDAAAAAAAARPSTPHSPEVWWTPRNSWALSHSSSSNSSLFSCISESPCATPRPTPPAPPTPPPVSPPPPDPPQAQPLPGHSKGEEADSRVGGTGHSLLH